MEEKVNKKVEMNVDMESLNKLKIWWNLAYDNGNFSVYDKCRRVYNREIGDILEVDRYMKFGESWDSLKSNDLAYICDCPLDSERGIIKYYYSKDDIIRICKDNKVIGKHVYESIVGERVEDYFRGVLEYYLDYFINEESSNIYISDLSISVYKVLSDDDREKVDKIIDKSSGSRKKKCVI